MQRVRKVMALFASIRWLLVAAGAVILLRIMGMAWSQMILDFIASIAWPLALVAGGIGFRKELRAAFPFLESLEGPGGWKASFGRRVAEAREQREAATAQLIEAKVEFQATSNAESKAEVIKDVPTTAAIADGEPTAPNFSQIERKIVDLLGSSPRQAVIELRYQVLQAIRGAGPGIGLTGLAMTSIASAGHALIGKQNPLLSGWGDLLLSFDNTSLECLNSAYVGDDFTIGYVAGNLNWPATIYDVLSFSARSRASTAGPTNTASNLPMSSSHTSAVPKDK